MEWRVAAQYEWRFDAAAGRRSREAEEFPL